MSNLGSQQIDVIVVGGGMVGATTALALADIGLRVAVVEGQLPKTKWDKKGFDLRVSAISRASQNILSAVNAWDDMAKMRMQPYTDMHVWDSAGSGVIHFDSADIGEPYLGHIVENRVIQQALWQQMSARQGIVVLCPGTPQRLAINIDQVYLQLSDGTDLAAKLLIAADGSQSWVRQQLAIQSTLGDYQQKAVVTTVKTEKPHQQTAWQRFLPEGPLAFLPLPDGYSSIVWSVTNEKADELLRLDDVSFSDQLAAAFGYQLGEIESIAERGAFPLRYMHAQQYVQTRIALVGDAAHTIHPLAGQGVNLGFADAATLAEVIKNASINQQDIGSFSILRRYERWRRGDNSLMLNAMTGFQRVFSSQNGMVRIMRNLGLDITQKAGPVKNELIRHAMGIRGDLPEMARRPMRP